MRKLWNDGWQFVKLPLGSAYQEMERAEKTPVTLPHDWLIAQPEKLYESADGWYVKTLNAGEIGDKVVLLDFDGVYMDADVLLNGQVLCTHHYGYTPFFADLTDRLKPGGVLLIEHGWRQAEAVRHMAEHAGLTYAPIRDYGGNTRAAEMRKKT